MIKNTNKNQRDILMFAISNKMFRNRIKCFIVSFLLSIFFIASFAQSVEWSLSPVEYKDIKCIGKQIYKMANENGHLTIMTIRANGKAESIVTCDETTPFYESWALLIQREGEKRRVIGCLSSNGAYHLFDNVFYTLANQEFFSEGFLTVENGKGEKVYIDYMGNEKIVTGKNTSRITPFSEGFAVVFVNNDEESYYINKDGQSPQIRSSLLNNVTLGQVTNFYQGKALMMGKSKDYFICDINGNGEKLSKRPDVANSLDYLYRIINNGEEVHKIPPYDSDYKGEDNVVVKLKVAGKGKQTRYGYDFVEGNNTMLPCQFAHAEPFIDGFAIVKMANGQFGILKYLSEPAVDFRITPIKKVLEYDKPLDKVNCQFMCLPAEWHGTQLQAEVTNLKDIVVASEGNGLFSFTYHPAGKSSNVAFNINLLAEGILLCTDTIIIEFKQKEPPRCNTCRLEITKCKDKGIHKICTDKNCKRIIDHNGIVKGRCPVNGGVHPQPNKRDKCPRCGLPIDKCDFGGKHPDF